MRTFEQQRREFIELALKLINNPIYEDSTVIHTEYRFAVVSNWYYEFRFKINRGRNDQNETEIQKLRELVGELG